MLISVLAVLRGVVRSRTALHFEILALRHHLYALQRSRPRRLRLAQADRWLWAWLSRAWSGWRGALLFVKPRHCHRLAAAGLPRVRDVEESPTERPTTRPSRCSRLIRTMSQENPLWGAPRIHGELLKLGVHVSQATVAKYIARPTMAPPSQSWRTFLANHVKQIAAADFFMVPTATCRLLFVLIILMHQHRRIVHIAVTPHSTAAWTAQQFREAFPWDQPPRYLIHDRDLAFQTAVAAKAMGIQPGRSRTTFQWRRPRNAPHVLRIPGSNCGAD